MPNEQQWSPVDGTHLQTPEAAINSNDALDEGF